MWRLVASGRSASRAVVAAMRACAVAVSVRPARYRV